MIQVIGRGTQGNARSAVGSLWQPLRVIVARVPSPSPDLERSLYLILQPFETSVGPPLRPSRPWDVLHRADHVLLKIERCIL